MYMANKALSIWIKRSQRDHFCFLALVAELRALAAGVLVPLLSICGLALAVWTFDFLSQQLFGEPGSFARRFLKETNRKSLAGVRFTLLTALGIYNKG